MLWVEITARGAEMEQYWLGVVSRTHVERAVAGGFAQVCHGRAAPLRRMRPGDWLVYYSATEEMGGGERLQAFTALGQLVDDRIYEVELDEWRPHRRAVRYEAVGRVPIAALAPQLHLTAQPHWGVALRRGHLPLDAHDFQLIAAALRKASPRRDMLPRANVG
jgi:EVE domain